MKPIIISIDGLDGVGKTTFAKNLTEHLINSKMIEDVNVIYQHFPRYDTPTGEVISSLLKDGDLTDGKTIDELVINCAQDRANWWKELQDKINQDEINIIIADRYRLSNLIYNGWRYMNEDYKKICKKMIKIEDDYGVERELLPILMVGSLDMRINRLVNRGESEDQNEKIEMVKFLDKKFNEFMTFNLVSHPFIVLADEIDDEYSHYQSFDNYFEKINFVADIYGVYIDMITGYINGCFENDIFSYFGLYNIHSFEFIQQSLIYYLTHLKGENIDD